MKFKIEDLVSVSTGILLGKMDGIYQVMEFLAGGPVWTHQIPVLHSRAAEIINEQYPQFKDINIQAMEPEEVPAVVDSLRIAYGAEVELTGGGTMSLTGANELLANKQVIGVVYDAETDSAKLLDKYEVTRDVTPQECHWLESIVPKGTEVYICVKSSYGACSDPGLAVTYDPLGGYPFFELPLDALKRI